MNEIRSIAIVGAGNVAFHLGTALTEAGLNISGIYNRTPEKAVELAQQLTTKAISTLEELKGNDLVICCVSDAALPELMPKLAAIAPAVTTSGATDILHYTHDFPIGVIYPLQSFSKGVPVDFKTIPLFIESANPVFTRSLIELGSRISQTVTELSAEKRSEVHLAAVFINNFTNHLVDIAQQQLEASHLPFEWLQPLLRQTVSKLETQSAKEAQTGPARRHDIATMQKHLSLLSKEHAAIYELISSGIQQRFPAHD